MPSESTFKRPAYHIWLLGPAGSGKTFAALSFPRICAIQFDPTGLDIIYDPDSRASEFRKNLIWRIPLNGLPREDVFAPDTGQVNETSLYGAINTAIQLKQKGQCDTLLLDGYTFLASERWNHIFTNEDEQIRTTKGNLDHQKMYGRLGSWLAAFTLQDLPRLCTVYGMNVVVTCHLQRESENAIKGMDRNTGNQMLDQQAKAQKRLVTLDSDMAPQIVGSFRQQVDALPSAMIYLDHFQGVAADGKTPIEKHLAFCRQAYVKRWDTVVKAKNRYGLPASMDVTGKSFHGILVGKWKAAEEARKAKEEAQVKAAAEVQTGQAEGASGTVKAGE